MEYPKTTKNVGQPCVICGQPANAQATVETLQAQLVTLKRHADLDCGDQSCLYAMNHGGMRTNGGCRCNPKRMKEDLQRAQAALDVAREKVAAVAKERDVQCTLKQNCISMLEQEREKVKGLHEITKVICTHCCEPMEIASKAVLQTQLTQLQALVRAISETMEPFRKSLAKLDEVDTLATRRIAEADAYYCAQRVLATLDATTPAPKGGDGE